MSSMQRIRAWYFDTSRKPTSQREKEEDVNNNFINLPFQVKVKSATNLRIAWKRHYCFNTSGGNFHK